VEAARLILLLPLLRMLPRLQLLLQQLRVPRLKALMMLRMALLRSLIPGGAISVA
jgi:hypothetical protein